MDDEDSPAPAAAAPGNAWCVMRQDDNGHAFLIAADLSRDEATAMAAEFEARGHKQMYWIRRQ